MTKHERRTLLEEVFTVLSQCPVVKLQDSYVLGMRREDAAMALASLNGGVVPMPREVYDGEGVS